MDAATLTVTYYAAEDFAAVEHQLLAVYAEVYRDEAATDPFFSIERFTERLHAHARGSRWGCAFGEIGGEPVGYAYGFARTAAYRWSGLLTPVPDAELTETDTRTFALCEVMVREPWRGTGIAHTLHEELMSHRIEERSHLLVEEEHPKVRAVYERWGYRWMGTMQPYPDAPRYDSLVRPLI
ncbi:GNAT family N-acetyltransferase [Kitasatospora mediocidica]|uniref:GNAT family N-acetyltransferase n=1 Tax=Kitasatospora mediocidica TaxID=58352 RepID=UPI00068B23DA|nr:GNAT family N-acetyltransferase [Kitasatospora mediocidica]